MRFLHDELSDAMQTSEDDYSSPDQIFFKECDWLIVQESSDTHSPLRCILMTSNTVSAHGLLKQIEWLLDVFQNFWLLWLFHIAGFWFYFCKKNKKKPGWWGLCTFPVFVLLFANNMPAILWYLL